MPLTLAATTCPYPERVQSVPLDHGTGDDAFTQASCYQRLARQLQEAVRRALLAEAHQQTRAADGLVTDDWNLG